jgi:hypothetical protein
MNSPIPEAREILQTTPREKIRTDHIEHIYLDTNHRDQFLNIVWVKRPVG